jgi:hypothetical protein
MEAVFEKTFNMKLKKGTLTPYEKHIAKKVLEGNV